MIFLVYLVQIEFVFYKLNFVIFYIQEKVDKWIEDNVYSFEVRMQKLEEVLVYDRKIIEFSLQKIDLVYIK